MPILTFRNILLNISCDKRLTEQEADFAFEQIMLGQVPVTQLAGFLFGLRVQGITSLEITAAIHAMRRHMISTTAPVGAIDVVGTGGDGAHTLNISSATALLTAACGVPVAKHGNKAATSMVGASDVFGKLGINRDVAPEDVPKMLADHGFAFLLAPLYHPAMRHAAEARSGLAVPTIFNILGPLVNPANVQHALIGCYNETLMSSMAESLSGMAMECVWLVHGANGLDELTTFGTNKIIEVKAGKTRTFTINAQDYDFATPAIQPGARVPKDLVGQNADYNADKIRSLFNGEESVFRDHVVLNTGAALYITEKVNSLREGINLAKTTLDSGKASHWLENILAKGKDKVFS